MRGTLLIGACGRDECEREGGWDEEQEEGESSSHGISTRLDKQ